MRVTLSKLRVAVVLLALLLVGGVASFVVYGRRMARQFARALPKQLAKQLLQESFHVSFSHSEHGKTVFTVHAAKEQKWTSGLITLEDVGIELYGRQDGAPDRIHGSRFEFDQAKGLLTAVGDVYIDLAAPAGKDGQVDGEKTLHVKTSGLVFNQKTRTATTEAAIEFQAAGLTGTAVGADYDSERQFIVLRSAVRVSGLRNNHPVLLTAAHAEIDRKADVADLRGAKYGSPGESLAADVAHILLTDSGDARAVEAQGHVVLAGDGRGTLYGDRLQATMGEGKVRDGHLWGSVRYVDRAAGRDVQGHAEDLRVLFSPAGAPEHAWMMGSVAMQSRTAAATRSMTAGRVELALADAGNGRTAVRQATATENAVLRLDANGVNGRSSDEVRGDVLKAAFTGAGASARVSRLDGTGHTSVHQVAANGADEQSLGDVLEVEFSGAGKGTEIAHAVQRGSFRTVRMTPARAIAGRPAAAPTVTRGQAAQATFDGAANRLVMSGGAQVTEQADLLQADNVSLDRATGDAEAEGNVRVSYTQAAGADGKPGEPVHLVAARSVERKAAGTAEFFGAAGGDARMWQGGSQVSAPVLSFDRGKKMMFAHGPGEADVVRTLLANTATPKPGAKDGGAVRVASHTLRYVDGTREAVFSGHVRLDDQDGALTAREATVYLLPAGGGSGAKPVATAGVGGLPTGQVERIVAQGAVRVEQTDRHAEGEELVYTAADRTFAMTGTAAARPSMTDGAQGTITGKMLRFRTGDVDVQVLGGEGDAGRVRSDLRVKQR